EQAMSDFGDDLLRADMLFARRYLWDRTRGVPIYLGLSVSQDEIDSAIADLKEALEIYRRLQPSRMKEILNALGNLYRRAGDWDLAEARFREGLEMLDRYPPQEPARQGKNVDYWRAILRGNLALVAGARGRYAEATAELLEISDDLSDIADR